jgi:hypothetical protein
MVYSQFYIKLFYYAPILQKNVSQKKLMKK